MQYVKLPKHYGLFLDLSWKVAARDNTKQGLEPSWVIGNSALMSALSSGMDFASRVGTEQSRKTVFSSSSCSKD
jgi:hypothetical protein